MTARVGTAAAGSTGTAIPAITAAAAMPAEVTATEEGRVEAGAMVAEAGTKGAPLTEIV
jgi:hypothetical protein